MNRHYRQVNGLRITTARYKMEQKLGRSLSSKEVVHHIDGNKLNDEISNLEVLLVNEHIQEHIRRGDIKPYGGNTGTCLRRISGNPNEAWCARCKQFLNKSNFHKNKNHWNGVNYYCKQCIKDRAGRSRQITQPAALSKEC